MKLRPWTTLAHVSFDLGPRLRRGTKNRSLRTILERAPSNVRDVPNLIADDGRAWFYLECRFNKIENNYDWIIWNNDCTESINWATNLRRKAILFVIFVVGKCAVISDVIHSISDIIYSKGNIRVRTHSSATWEILIFKSKRTVITIPCSMAGSIRDHLPATMAAGVEITLSV